VEFAVLECARGGILRSGLGFDECDCAIVTNVAEDHLGLDGIDTVEKLAKVKSVVPETVKKDGYAILNADDDLVYAMKDRVKCKVGLFSLHIDNVRIQQHCEQGGIAAISDEGYLLIREGNKLTVIDEVQNVPITYAGKAKFNVANVLAAALAAYVSNINLDGIRKTLRSFSSSAEEIPGRMNEFRFDGFTVMVDYAHNPHGLRAFGEFITSVPATKKIGVIAGVGDRRNEDIMALAEEAARIFDEIVIRMDEDLRGRTESEIYSLLRNGIHKVDPGKKVNYFSTEADAVDNVVHHAEQGSLTVIFADKVDLVCNKLKEYRDQFAHANHSMKQTA
jgi:cyanophycin synthetase